jgi:NADH:ubiquinone oxidoreductase subunit 2 (subunit N)
VQIGWPLAAVFILSSILALIAYVLALTGIWWGPQSDADSPPNPPFPNFDSPAKEPFLLRTSIVLLVVLILAAGIWPSLLDMLKWGRL